MVVRKQGETSQRKYIDLSSKMKGRRIKSQSYALIRILILEGMDHAGGYAAAKHFLY